MSKIKFVPYDSYHEFPPDEMLSRSKNYLMELRQRRSVRDFSNRPVSAEIIANCIAAAGTAPSGANKQPWFFVAVSNPEVKTAIRRAAEEIESDFYQKRAPESWLQDLEEFGTDEYKPNLEDAPWLIVIFEQKYQIGEEGERQKNYYTRESIGIATGMLITAVHHAGLVCLTHTPSPMEFLNEILERPESERPFLVLLVGYPAVDVQIPDIKKKKLDQISSFVP